MIKRVGRYLRHHHLALLALFLVLGGGSAYAAATLAPRNSVGSAQVINGSLQTVDLSKKAKRALRGLRGPRGLQGARGATGAQGAQGAQGAKGTTGAQGPAGSALAYGKVSGAGVLDSAHSKNITSVTRPGTGLYCITPSVSVNNAVATIGFGADINSDIYIELTAGFCSAGSLGVATYNGAGAGTNEPFMFALN
jgi:hypothetical protein